MSVHFAGDAITLLPVLLQEKMKMSVVPLMMRIVTTHGSDKPNHRVTIKLKCSIKLKWLAIDKLYMKAVSDGSQSNIAQKVIFYCLGSNFRLFK